MKKVVGIDEAGRGAVLGPLVICGAVSFENKIKKLKDLEVKDSKEHTPKERLELQPKIEEVIDGFEMIRISPEEIDESRNTGTNLNELEVKKMAQIINETNPDVAYLDAVDPNENSFKGRLSKYLDVDVELIAEHGADAKYPIVSAASILAKVARDADIEELKRIYDTDLGNGYPHDSLTQTFLKEWLQENKKLPKIVRKTWATAINAVGKQKQKSLESW
ncbi:MAG: ribonuclease HII [Candidatus Undinarchaeales archaeon]